MNDPDERVSLRDLIQKPVRLRKELIRQVDAIRGRRGQTFQTFVQLAIVKAVAEANDEFSRSSSTPGGTPKKATPRGLGIRDRLQPSFEDTDSMVDEAFETAAPPPTTSSAAPVTINVGNTAPAAGTSDITTLARMVVEGARHDRRRLLESACKALRAAARSPEESVQLAEALDAEIKRIDVPTTALERVRARRNSK